MRCVPNRLGSHPNGWGGFPGAVRRAIRSRTRAFAPGVYGPQNMPPPLGVQFALAHWKPKLQGAPAGNEPEQTWLMHFAVALPKLQQSATVLHPPPKLLYLQQTPVARQPPFKHCEVRQHAAPGASFVDPQVPLQQTPLQHCPSPPQP